ncbi:MAG TPA: hypothetical protein VGQ17_03545 [Gemmatimonadales bacterium]|jgi:hypothetical protein|nr:hypothetical protein [Gemmatimonadales bacterium]
MAKTGWFFAKAYCIIALVILLLKGPQLVASHAWELLGILLAYVVGWVLAGIIVGLAFPLTRNFVGRVFVAILAMVPISTAIRILVLAEKSGPRAWGPDLIKPVLIFAVFFGFPIAVYTWVRGWGRE